jgi:DNA-binding NarL/FixJ family response regulator
MLTDRPDSETRVLVVDDHEVVREGLCQFIDSHPGYRVVAQAGDGRDAVLEQERTAPDVTVMDVWLPRLSGIAATAEIRRARPDAKVVVLSVHEKPEVVEDALRAGASAYVVKRAPGRELITAIDAARDGKLYISPEVADGVVAHIMERDHGPGAVTHRSCLTPREREILQRVAEGLSAKEIAADLHISVRTVETHRCSVMRKLGVHKTSNLVRIAIREGLIAP